MTKGIIYDTFQEDWLKTITLFKLKSNKSPFEEWIKSLSATAKASIYAYIERTARGGGKKNIKPLGNGIYEIKINKGPGYRVYFGEIDNTIILLLLAGDKSNQQRDITKAKEYWRLYNA